MQGVESIDDGVYARSVRMVAHRGWIRVRNASEKRSLVVEVSQSLTPVLPALLGRVRNMFDLAARPDIICAQLMHDPVLAGSVARNPGLRVPGAFDGFELAVRAVLGQQITVKAATTLAGRFAGVFGEEIVPGSSVNRFAARRMCQCDELVALAR